MIPLVDITSSEDSVSDDELCHFRHFPWLTKRKKLKNVLSEKSIHSDTMITDILEKTHKFQFHSEVFLKELKSKKLI